MAARDACLSAANDAVAKAIKVGKSLAEAKVHIPHGQWEQWIKDNLRVRPRQARSYLFLYENRDKLSGSGVKSIRDALNTLHLLQDESNSFRQRAADLTSGIPPEEQASKSKRPRPITEWEFDTRREYCVKWWDIFAKWTVTLNAAEWPIARIAEFLLMPVEDVRAILDPVIYNRLDTMPYCDAGAYRDGVEYLSNLTLAIVYAYAVDSCKRDGFPDAKPVLEASLRRLQGRIDTAEASGTCWGYMSFDGGDRDQALLCCVTSDGRHALRTAADEVSEGWRPEFEEMFRAYQSTGDAVEA
jgi:hypothetical protein